MSAEDDVAGIFSPYHGLSLAHQLDNAAIPDLAGRMVYAQPPQSRLQAEVAHDRGDDQVVVEPSSILVHPGARGDDLVAGQPHPLLVDGDQPIPISVEGQTHIGAQLAHLRAQALSMLGSAVLR